MAIAKRSEIGRQRKRPVLPDRLYHDFVELQRRMNKRAAKKYAVSIAPRKPRPEAIRPGDRIFCGICALRGAVPARTGLLSFVLALDQRASLN